MADELRIREAYTLARCCLPQPPDEIIGYYSYDNVLKVHVRNCPNLGKAEADRLVNLTWSDVIDDREVAEPDDDYGTLEPTDFAVLAHHDQYGVDYAQVVARRLNIGKEDAFERHRKLRDLGLITRVEPLMIQYRKGIVNNKWIKHRNHTYYDLTEKGRTYLAWWREHDAGRR